MSLKFFQTVTISNSKTVVFFRSKLYRKIRKLLFVTPQCVHTAIYYTTTYL